MPATVVVQVGASGNPGPPVGPGPPGTDRLLALLSRDRYRVRSGRLLRVRFAVSAPGRVRLELRKRSRRLATKRLSMSQAGVGRLRLYARRKGLRRARRLDPGRYQLRLAVTGADGQRAVDTARLRITG